MPVRRSARLAGAARLLAVPAACALVLVPASVATADDGLPSSPVSLPVSLPVPTPPSGLPTTLPTEISDPLAPVLGPLGLTGAASPTSTAGGSTSTSGSSAGSGSHASPAAAGGGASSDAGAASPGTPSASVGGGLAGAGKGCLSAGEENGGGLVVLGQDLLGQLAEQVPNLDRFVVPCTAENGLAVDADLVAATVCLRLDPSAPEPLRASISLLGQDVLKQLEQAGLPLDQLIVPCPEKAGDTSGPTVSGTSSSQAAAPVRSPRTTAAADATGRLPYTGGAIAFPTLAGIGFLALGTLLVRGTRRRVPSGAHR